jgi:3-methyladenine DNA glycosylase AlkD
MNMRRMRAAAIVEELRCLGQDGTRRVLLRHGAAEPCFGVKVGDLKVLRKRVKVDHPLALELFGTGIFDARYLAGLIVDDARMTPEDLHRWADQACRPLAGSTVPWVAAGSAHGAAISLEWIESERELVAVAGWGTLVSLVAVKPDAELDLPMLKGFLRRVQGGIHDAPNLVRYQMNEFLIAAGRHVKPLTAVALEIAEGIGRVSVDVGQTACQVPHAEECIRKAMTEGKVGGKRKSAKC